jgi:general secretion pathway protein E
MNQDRIMNNPTNTQKKSRFTPQSTMLDCLTADPSLGMVLMRDDGQRLVDAGITSREELLRVTRD